MLSHVGYSQSVLKPINRVRLFRGLHPIAPGPLPVPWRDLYIASFIDAVCARSIAPPGGRVIARNVKFLAAAAPDTHPSHITADAVQLAYNAALIVGTTATQAVSFETFMRIIIDAGHLAERVCLASFCLPYPNEYAENAYRNVKERHGKANGWGDVRKIRRQLAERKSGEKLPTERAFWERQQELSFAKRRNRFMTLSCLKSSNWALSPDSG